MKAVNQTTRGYERAGRPKAPSSGYGQLGKDSHHSSLSIRRSTGSKEEEIPGLESYKKLACACCIAACRCRSAHEEKQKGKHGRPHIHRQPMVIFLSSSGFLQWQVRRGSLQARKGYLSLRTKPLQFLGAAVQSILIQTSAFPAVFIAVQQWKHMSLICRSVIEKVDFTDERDITDYSFPGFEVRR
eukprot:1145354-Pelagomonas_calceolata.AAC.3